MENEYIMGCPECSMFSCVNSAVIKDGDHFKCSANPMHKFMLGEDGFLKSV